MGRLNAVQDDELIGLGVAAVQLSLPYRAAYDLLGRGVLVGVRRGGRWFVTAKSVAAAKRQQPGPRIGAALDRERIDGLVGRETFDDHELDLLRRDPVAWVSRHLTPEQQADAVRYLLAEDDGLFERLRPEIEAQLQRPRSARKENGA